MLRRGIRRILPKRDNWYALQEFAAAEADVAEFREARVRDTAVSAVISKAGSGKGVDWASWEQRIVHKDLLTHLKDFHTQQEALLNKVLAEDHAAAAKAQTGGWELFDAAVKSCEKSVEKSEDIVKNGSRALFISFHNPPISMVSQSEWIDTDQYWAAFVEKHQFYHNHICSAVEDPESKEYDAKQQAEMVRKWNAFDGRNVTRMNNKLLYQRPSYEYYDVHRGPLVEHMIFYLTKTGGDARFFPECMPATWFGEIYDIRFKLYNVIQRRKRAIHEAAQSREAHMDFHPHDLDHDGEAYFAKLIAKESAMIELMTARLMGNFILFSDAYIPVQNSAGYYRALQSDGGAGTFYSLGADVHALFYKPATALAMPDPSECFQAIQDHLVMTGRRFPVAYSVALEEFCNVLESRKEGLGGSWLTAPGETTQEAFMRRLKTDDPSSAIFEAYSAEYTEKWADAKTLTHAEAAKEMPEIERKYKLECEEYSNILYGINDELSTASKLEIERITKLADAGELQGLLDQGAIVAVQDEKILASAGDIASGIEAFEAEKDKAVETVMGTKTALDARR